MKTITEYKDDISKQHGYKDFIGVLKSFDCAKTTYYNVNIIINEAMKEYAKQTAIAQREACAENAQAFIGVNDEPVVAKGSILNTKLVVD